MDSFDSKTPMSDMSTGEPKSSLGPAVGLVIILILIILGSFYFLKSSKTPISQSLEEPSVADIDDDLRKLEEQSDSDDPESIEKDLKDTDLTTLDQEMEQIDEEISQLEAEL